jgi:hypothetical protein
MDSGTRITGGGSGYAALLAHAEGVLYGTELGSVTLKRVVLYGKRSFFVTTPCPRPTRVNTERLAERETLLYRLGSELNRTV